MSSKFKHLIHSTFYRPYDKSTDRFCDDMDLPEEFDYGRVFVIFLITALVLSTIL